jgi:hypothetical protein
VSRASRSVAPWHPLDAVGGCAADRLAAILLAAAFTAVLLLLRPLQDAPFVDDWTYAWSVRWLLEHRQLRVLEWSSNFDVAQVLWGAAFCLPRGFSFSALRLSTLLAGAAGVAGMFVLLRQIGVRRRMALLGAAALAVHPLYALLSVTFMTDVPFVAVSIWASIASIAALRGSRTAFVLALTLGAIACGIRSVGVALPCALCATALLSPDAVPRRWLLAGCSLAPLAVAGALLWLASRLTVSTIDISQLVAAPVNRWALLRFAPTSIAKTAPMLLCFAAGAIGLAAAPLTAGAPGRTLRAALFGGLAALAVVLLKRFGATVPEPLVDKGTWTLQELGATMPLLIGDRPASLSSVAWMVGAVSGASFGCWLAAVGFRFHGVAERFLACLLLAHLGLMLLLWLFYDRYALVLFPPAIALFLVKQRQARELPRAVAILVLACITAIGLRDHLELNRAVWRGVDWLEARGVDPSEIDGGYAVNGWLHYADPEEAPRRDDGRAFVPGMTAPRGGVPYGVTVAGSTDERTLARFPFDRLLGRRGAIVVTGPE